MAGISLLVIPVIFSRQFKTNREIFTDVKTTKISELVVFASVLMGSQSAKLATAKPASRVAITGVLVFG